MTIHRTRTISIFPKRVPLLEVYSPISENSHSAYVNEIKQSTVEVTLAHDGIQVDSVVAILNPVI